MRWPRARNGVAALSLALVATGCPSPDVPPQPVESDGRILHRGLGAEPGTLDPRRADDNAALTVVADLYEGLTAESRDGAIVPGAARAWIVREHGLEYAFELRPGLRWSNGDALTAEHFAAGLAAALATDSAAPGADLLAGVAAVDAIGPTTLRIRLHRAVPQLPALLALPLASPLHPDAASSAERAPTNGAYRLLRRTPGQRIELERNPNYRAATEVAIARVDHVIVTDLTTELNLYRTGALDLTSEVPNTRIDELRRQLPGELQLHPYLSTYSYAVNLERLPGQSARLALAMAVDRERITRQVTGAGEVPAFGWVPDGIPHYAPARFDWRQLPYPQSSAQARALWTKARADGVAPATLRLCTDASTNHHRTAVALADLWHTALGVETEIVELDWKVYLDTRHHPGECDLVRLGWSADYVDPEAFAAIFETAHRQNTLGYSSRAYDDLLARSRAAPDTAQRMALLAAAEAQLLEDVPVIPVFFRVSKRLMKPDLLGAGPNPLGHLASRDLSFAPR